MHGRVTIFCLSTMSSSVTWCTVLEGSEWRCSLRKQILATTTYKITSPGVVYLNRCYLLNESLPLFLYHISTTVLVTRILTKGEGTVQCLCYSHKRLSFTNCLICRCLWKKGSNFGNSF